MKTLQIKLVASLLFLFTAATITAQTNAGKSNTLQRAEAKKTATQVNKVSTTNVEKNNTKNSEYMGMENKIKGWTISNEIPAEFPKYKEGQTKEEYSTIVKEWSRNNLKFFKKEHHTKFTAKSRTKPSSVK
jgi:Ni/Co efflux regulator RcnB